MWIKTIDGQYFTGASALAVIDAMRDAAWFKEDSRAAYMQAVADRARIWNGSLVETHSAERFLTTLFNAGLIDKGETQ